MRSGNPRLPRQVLVEGTAKASEPDYAHASPFSVNSQPCFYVVCNLRCMNNLCNHKQACKSPFGVCFFTKEIFLPICISSKSLRVESPAEVMGGDVFLRESLSLQQHEVQDLDPSSPALRSLSRITFSPWRKDAAFANSAPRSVPFLLVSFAAPSLSLFTLSPAVLD